MVLQDRILPLSPEAGYETAAAAAYVVVGEMESEVLDFPSIDDLDDMIDSLSIAESTGCIEAFVKSDSLACVFHSLGTDIAVAAPIIKSHTADMQLAQDHLRSCIVAYNLSKKSWK